MEPVDRLMTGIAVQARYECLNTGVHVEHMCCNVETECSIRPFYFPLLLILIIIKLELLKFVIK